MPKKVTFFFFLCVLHGVGGDNSSCPAWGKEMPSGVAKDLTWGTLVKSPVNCRHGPGSTYPIAVVYEAPMLPVKILAMREGFYKIQDHQGEKCWVNKSMISTKVPTFLLLAPCPFYAQHTDTHPFAIVEQDVILKFKDGDSKGTKGDRSLFTVRKHEGWIDRKTCLGWGEFHHAEKK